MFLTIKNQPLLLILKEKHALCNKCFQLHNFNDMPKILEYFGFVFYFYSNEHLPIHVHVSYNEYESVFELFFDDGNLISIEHRKVAGIEPLPEKQRKEALKVVETYSSYIANAWMDYFVLNKKTKSKKITKKV